MDINAKVDQALAYFLQGYNCAQSVVTAFHEEMGMTESAALRLSSSMGGGIGGLREVCGAFTGLSMVLGAVLGYDSPADAEAKQAHYALIQKHAALFTEKYNTLICRDLLASHGIKAGLVPSARTAAYYQERPCAMYVEACATMVAEALHAQQI